MEYFLDSDDDGHWYLIEANHRLEWAAWLDELSDDVMPPDYAKALGGAPNIITFNNPKFR